MASSAMKFFEHGSFLQSKMYAAGATCSDCHDPHTGVRKA